MAHSFLLALSDPFINTSQMFNVLECVVGRTEMVGYSKEDIDDTMVANARARIEMEETPRMLRSAFRPKPSRGPVSSLGASGNEN